MKHYSIFFVIAIILFPMLASAQRKDSVIVKDSAGTVVAKPKKVGFMQYEKDTSGKRIFNPRRAAIYSAIMPGLGQIYNRKYWKVPLAYAAVGIPIYTFLYNKKWYDRTRYALAVVESTDKNTTSYSDSLSKVNSSLMPLVVNGKQTSLLNYRNEFRKDMDYSILITLLLWGVNVIDATVDAHLKGFNVSDNLALQVKPAILSNQSIGVCFVLKYK